MRLNIFLLILTMGLIACGSEEISYSADVWPIIDARCTVCHDTAGQTAYDSKVLFEDAAGTYDVLLNSAVSSDIVGGFTQYVVPGNADASVFYDKIANDPPSAGGDPMPGSGRLDAADIEKVKTWIDTGAPNN